jgi:3-deoxy-D-manno-octulosonic acid (KDO) 8-phosphate synthase
MAMTTCELTWLKALLESLGVSHPAPMSLHCDSQSALHMSQLAELLNALQAQEQRRLMRQDYVT